MVTVLMLSLCMMMLVGSLSLLIKYHGERTTQKINYIKAYYAAITGINYARQHFYDDLLYVIYDYPQKIEGAGDGYAGDSAACIKQASLAIPGVRAVINIERTGAELNSDIISTAKVGGSTVVLNVTSGHPDFPLDICQGIYGINYGIWIGCNRYLHESQLPITRWRKGD